MIAQVAVSLLLLVSSSLVTRSLEAARRTDPGYDGSRVASIAVDLKQNGYDEAHGRAFYRRLIDAARGDVAISSATLAAYEPLAFLDTPSRSVSIEGYEVRRSEYLAFLFNTIGPEYFRTLRINLIAGRAFEERDDDRAAPLAIVNTTFAKRFWYAPASAIGRRIRVADGEWRTVIGGAADVKYLRINEAPRPYFYVPFLQAYRPNMLLQTRGTASMEAVVAQTRAKVITLDANLPVLYRDNWPIE